MEDEILADALQWNHGQAMALAEGSDILSLLALDGPPAQHYIASYQARTLVQDKTGKVVEATRFDIGIALPDDYLVRVDLSRVLTYLGPHARPFHPNVKKPYICMEVAPGTPLCELLHSIYELFTWNPRLTNTGDGGLNRAASQWYRHQDRSRFPIDSRPLKRRRLRVKVTPEARRTEP